MGSRFVDRVGVRPGVPATARLGVRTGLVAAVTLVASSCGLPGTPDLLGSDDSSVEVSVVNAEPVEADSLSSAVADGGSSDSGAEDDSTGGADGGDGSDGAEDADGSPSAGDGSSSTGGSDATSSGTDQLPTIAVDELAIGDAITLVGDDKRMSTNPKDLTRGWGLLDVDRASTTASYDGQGATVGFKLLVVDYQVLGGDSGNFFDQAIRAIADGEVYPNLVGVNEISGPGWVFNSTAVFEIPETATEVRFEAGAPEGERDGFTAGYDLALSPAAEVDDPTAELSAPAIERRSDEITLVSSGAVMTTNTKTPDRGSGTLTIDEVRTSSRIDAVAAGSGRKFVIFDYQVASLSSGNFFQDAFRLEAAGEWYSPLTRINEIVGPGVVINSEVVFEVPAEADGLVLEAGFPTRLGQEGLTATFEITFADDEDTGGDGSQDAAADVELEAEAWDITLIHSDGVMSTNPGTPLRGAGELTIDSARTTVKIEAVGAEPGFKFVVVDFQLSGLSSGNFFNQAFRMQANGEWFSPLTRINEIVGPGVVFNGELVFQVPETATSVILEGGVPLGSVDGTTTRYEIEF